MMVYTKSTTTTVLFTVLVLGFANLGESQLEVYKTVQRGDGTFYGFQDGSRETCQLARGGRPPAGVNGINRYVAMNLGKIRNSFYCGMCIQFSGSGQGRGLTKISGSFNGFVTDGCAGCKAGDIDLAVDGDGRWDVRWKAVQCNVGNTKLQYQFEGSNRFYLKIKVRNARIPVRGLSLINTRTGLPSKHANPTPDGHFVLSGGAFKSPLLVELTAINGAKVKDAIRFHEGDLSSGRVISGQAQIPFDPTLD